MERDELDDMIAAGWGDMRRDRIPADWRTRKPPIEGASEYFTSERNDESECRAARILRGPYVARISPTGPSAIELAKAVMANEAARKKPGRPKGTKGIKHRELHQRVQADQAEMRERLTRRRR